MLEHLAYEEQPRALAELFRVLRPGGELLVSVPNLAHLQSRIHFLLRGRLIRTASEYKHPGDRPVGEYLQLGRRAGFSLVGRHGIFPTVPVLTHLVRRHPRALAPLHRALTRLLPVPGWCFLNLLTFRKNVVFPKIRELSKNVTVYGLGDVAVSIVNFLLLGVYVTYFGAEDYGVIGILGAMEVIAKIVFRFGLDGSFMRFFYDCRRTRRAGAGSRARSSSSCSR